MGNTLSQKIENNSQIWKETYRNALTACVFGFLLTLLKYRRPLYQIYRQMTHKNMSEQQKEQFTNKYGSNTTLLMRIVQYFMRFPLFVATFSIVFKKLIRMNYISHAMEINLDSLPKQKYSITLMSFLLAYYMQQNVSIFHWKWALLLLIRSLYSLLRLSIPPQYQIFSVQDYHMIFAALMGCVFVSRYAKTLPGSIKATYQACYGYPQQKWINYYASNHRNMPTCSSIATFHQHNDKSCFKALIKDAAFVVFPHSFSFFIKLHFVASLISGKRFFRDLKSNPFSLCFEIIKAALRSCGYWVIGVHLAVRICSCFNKLFVKKMSKILHYLINKSKNVNDKYEYMNERNIYLELLVTSFVGRYNVLAEPKGRQIQIVLSLIWYQIIHIVRMNCKLETNDDDKYHFLLGSNSFVSLLFAVAFGINIYVFCKDAKYLKGMERNMISKFLIK